MSDVMTLLHQQPWGMIIILALFGTGAGIITAIAGEVRKYACHRREAELKRELVERGLSVDEIERIVRANSTDRDGAAHDA